MRLGFSRPQRPHTIYIVESYRDKDGKSTTRRKERLGTEEEIEKRYGCPDGLEWAKAYVGRLNEEKRLGKKKIEVGLSPDARIDPGECDKYHGGDLFIIPLYNRLGLKEECERIKKGSKAKFNLNDILEMLVVLRILAPCSKRGSCQHNKRRIRKTAFELEDVYKALSLLSSHIDDIQACAWDNSQKIMNRNTRVIFYDCTNYYFEIEDNDRDYIDKKTGRYVAGLRKRGRSKEHRPNPIVQMGLLMDGDGIPISFIIFPGNESEQPSLQRIEEMVAQKFGLNEFIISTDAGLSSEDNRRYNMTEGRDYIAVQSLPSLPAEDQKAALGATGWKIGWRDKSLPEIMPHDLNNGTYDLTKIDFESKGHEKERFTRFYKEIIVNKKLNGKKNSERPERVIVTYSHDFALYLKHKREERIKLAEKIVDKGQAKSRQSQQDPRKYVEAIYTTPEGEVADNVALSINSEVIASEERFDGFYAYGTSLDDDAVDVLRARGYHHEIEHLFRTTKSLLEARPVYLRREDRIKSHFLVCFLSMLILKILQKQLGMQDLSIDSLIETLRSFEFAYLKGAGYIPLFERNSLTDRLQEINNLSLDTQIVPQRRMNSYYRELK